MEKLRHLSETATAATGLDAVAETAQHFSRFLDGNRRLPFGTTGNDFTSALSSLIRVMREALGASERRDASGLTAALQRLTMGSQPC